MAMPLRLRLVTFVVLCALPLLVMSILQLREGLAQIEQSARSSAEIAASRLQTRIDRTLAAAEDKARLIAALDLESESARSRCSSLLAGSATATSLMNYLVVDAKGDVVCSAQPLRAPVNGADRPHIRQAMQTKQPVLSGYVVGRIVGRGVLHLVAPFVDGKGGMSHMGVAVISAKDLAMGESEPGAVPLTVAVFDRSGVLVSRYPDSPDALPGADFSGSELFRRATGPDAAADSVGLDGRKRHYAFRRVDFRGEPALWTSTGVDIAELQAAVWKEGARDLFVFLLVLASVVMLAGFASAPLILARYRGLQKVAEAVMSGNMGSRIELKWRDELTQVERALNEMLDALQKDRASLADSESRYRMLFEHNLDGVLLTEPGGVILAANPAACAMLQRDEGELKSLGRSAVVDATDPRLAALLEKRGRTGQARGEIRFIKADGAMMEAEVASSIFLDSGGTQRTCIVMRDLSELQLARLQLTLLNGKLEETVESRTAELATAVQDLKAFGVQLDLARSQAEEASRAKSDFLAAMSHEIRTPMGGLLGLLELMELTPLSENQHATLGLARESGESLMSIINDILDFSKIEAHRLDLNFEPGSVRWIVENAASLHGASASRKDLDLSVSVDPEISPLQALDPLRLGQILNNLLSNAIKFTERGAVEVSVERIARREEIEELRFVVRDSGIGMSAEQLGRLFQPFVQADVTTSNRFGGTGLGLVIARRLAELMGGTVEIESEPGRGTTATLTLALVVCDAAAAQPAASRRDLLGALVADRRPAPSIDEAQAEGTLLLVVDDHPTNRRVLLQQAASLGYAAEAAADGVQALELWRTGRFAAVITDCNMPRMNGYELAARIRELEQRGGQRRCPIIGCTANAQQTATDLCIGAGMDDCMVKPADLRKVSETLERWVPLPRPGSAPRAVTEAPVADPVGDATGAEGLVDEALLADISGGDAAMLSEMLADFFRTNEHDALALRQAAQRGDFAQVTEFSHRIKGATLMLGATRLSDACVRTEAAGAARNQDALDLAMRVFENELQRLNSHLETLT